MHHPLQIIPTSSQSHCHQYQTMTDPENIQNILNQNNDITNISIILI